MRYLRLFSVLFLVASILFSVWANIHYYSHRNADRPIITSDTTLLKISTADGSDGLLQGLHAQDKTDGDITDKIMIASISHFITPNTVNVKYVVFDSHNNSSTLTRKVEYTDYVAPTFKLLKSPVYTKGESFDLLDYVKAEDSIDGDITDKIRIISNTVSNYSSGVYPIIFEVTNSYGDKAQLEVMVTYLESKNTVSIKLHEYVVYIEKGESFNPQEWIASVTTDDNTSLDKSKVSVQGNLDTSESGCYQLNYSYDDGTQKGIASLTVVVGLSA